MPRRYDGETREMRLFSKVIAGNEAYADESLAQFLALRRMPGSPNWMSWEEIVFDLGKATDELVTDGSLRRWALRYGIPEGTTRDGKEGPSAAQYAKAVIKAGITI